MGAISGVGTNLIGSDPNTTTNVLNTVAYRGSGGLKSLNYGNGRRLQMGYDANRQQPTSMKVDMANNPSDKIIDYAYQYYDANGKNNNRIRKITDNVDTAYTTNYTYDDYNRLGSASAPAYSRSFGYDEWGNIKSFSGLTLNYATNSSGAPATNRISTAVSGLTTYTHSYDAAGNMTGDGQQTFSYDGANRLKEVGTGGQNTYGYDGNGMRVRVVAGGGLPTFYIRSSVRVLGQVAFEVNQNLVLRAYVNAAGKVIAQQSRDGQFYWLHTNHLGSGTKLTDSTGAVKSRAEFAPYGQTLLEWSSSGDTNLNTKKFTGYERDEAMGLDYANARMYTNGRGRFMQPDPIGLRAAVLRRPQSLNRYGYTENDPINFTDRTGRWRENNGCHWIWYLGDGGEWDCADEGQFEDAPLTLPLFPRPGKELKGGFGNYDPQDINTIIPPFNSNDQKKVDNAYERAGELVAKSECDAALKDYGIASLATLLGGLKVSGGAAGGQNVFDGRRATNSYAKDDDGNLVTVVGYLNKNRDVNAVATGDFVYLSGRFFSDGKYDNAITLIHEAVHLKGGKSDTDFGPNRKEGSRALTNLIKEKCK